MPSTTTLCLRRDACARRSAKFMAGIIAQRGPCVTSGRCVFASAAGILWERQRQGNTGMNNLTIVTKLRFMAAIAPAILLLAAALIAGAFHGFGTAPREIYENEYAAARAAQGMENAVEEWWWGPPPPRRISNRHGSAAWIHFGNRDRAIAYGNAR